VYTLYYEMYAFSMERLLRSVKLIGRNAWVSLLMIARVGGY